MVALGDMNARDEEIVGLCEELDLKQGFYSGCTWGKPGNRFDAEHPYRGPGLRYDRVLFRGKVWAEVHVVGDSRVANDGFEFYRSDHFGLMAFVDVAETYGARGKRGEICARARRYSQTDLRIEGCGMGEE